MPVLPWHRQWAWPHTLHLAQDPRLALLDLVLLAPAAHLRVLQRRGTTRRGREPSDLGVVVRLSTVPPDKAARLYRDQMARSWERDGHHPVKKVRSPSHAAQSGQPKRAKFPSPTGDGSSARGVRRRAGAIDPRRQANDALKRLSVSREPSAPDGRLGPWTRARVNGRWVRTKVREPLSVSDSGTVVCVLCDKRTDHCIVVRQGFICLFCADSVSRALNPPRPGGQ